MFIKRLIFLTIFTSVLFVMDSWGQHRNRRAMFVSEDTIPAIVRKYQDSLHIYKLHVDSVKKAMNSNRNEVNQQYYKLIVPLTFYNDISHDLFSLGTTTQDIVYQEINNALTHIYFSRPDLIRSTQSELAEEITAPTPENQTSILSQSPKKVLQAPIVEQNKRENMNVDIVIKKPNFWSFGADTYMQILQNYVSTNWYQGGQSNYSLVSSITLQANYNNKQKVKWDNKLEMKIGFQTSRDDTVHSVKTSEDLLRYTGKFGLQATKYWYYTLQAVAQTQFTRKYNGNSHTITADFFAPVQLNLSLGMDYHMEWFKKHLTGTIHLAPFAYNLKYVNREYLARRNGIDENRKVKNDYGSQITIDMTWKITDNIKWKARINGYTTYERTEFQAENTISFQFSKYISTNVYVYPRFDDSTKRDDHHGYWQYKEFASFGFNYSF